MEILESEWELLARLRERFLAPAGTPSRDYWESERLCELYDSSFGQRIAWKWRAVLGELVARGRLPRALCVLDWGCGSAIAAREFFAAGGADASTRFYLWDRSKAAMIFAAGKLKESGPRANVAMGLPAADAPLDVLLVSHVLGELDPSTLEDLLGWARRARSVIWVEPGERVISRALMGVRDQLIDGRSVLGPCTHSEGCGLNRLERERDWCHSFARPAPDVFTRADWREFSRRLKIDLRSVPYAYFALGEKTAAPQEPGLIRILGRPRMEKGHAKIDACDASGVRVLRVLERDAKTIVREFADATSLARTFRVTTDGERVRSIE